MTEPYLTQSEQLEEPDVTVDENYVAVRLNLSDIVPYAKNPRVNAHAVEKVKKSIVEFGYLVPIVVDTSNVIITGHTRYLALKELGVESVQVVVADHLTEAQAAAFRLADNRIAQEAYWDEGILQGELKSLREMGFDLDITGFSRDELDCLLEPIGANCLEDLNQAAVCGDAPRVEVITAYSTQVKVGGYSTSVPSEVFMVWERDMLIKHGSTNALLEWAMSQLGFTPEFIAANTTAPEPADDPAESAPSADAGEPDA
jgi:hypothetical protein